MGSNKNEFESRDIPFLILLTILSCLRSSSISNNVTFLPLSRYTSLTQVQLIGTWNLRFFLDSSKDESLPDDDSLDDAAFLVFLKNCIRDCCLVFISYSVFALIIIKAPLEATLIPLVSRQCLWRIRRPPGGYAIPPAMPFTLYSNLAIILTGVDAIGIH